MVNPLILTSLYQLLAPQTVIVHLPNKLSNSVRLYLAALLSSMVGIVVFLVSDFSVAIILDSIRLAMVMLCLTCKDKKIDWILLP